MRVKTAFTACLLGALLPRIAMAQDVVIKSSTGPIAVTTVHIVQGCFDENGAQATALARQALQRSGIVISDKSELTATLTTSPCKEFAFADRGPRALEDAPRGPLGSKIVTQINRPRDLIKSAGVQLVVRNSRSETVWDGRVKSDVAPGNTAQSTALNLVLPLVNALILQRSN
jgi:hypothetical protein